ncbi:hypothetical protein P5673_026752 [Acropora cervicornis]|uniref:Uncharacterized protein n=1 Tax=Acropora cervicornis TaxID=6130 RepID=A0AAD9UW75_ACRCE|nr:hypothetical protein P5673_026752 [Acropora cervicornis]
MYDQSQSSLGVLEMKFLWVKSVDTLEDILLKQHICIKRSNGTYINKCLQQLIHGYGGIYLEKVSFDEEFWSPVLLSFGCFHAVDIFTSKVGVDTLVYKGPWTRRTCLVLDVHRKSLKR